MSVLNELNQIFEKLNIPVETGVFSNKAPNTYIVLTPLIDNFDAFADNKPEVEIREVRLSLFTKENYTNVVANIVAELFYNDFTITQRRYIGHEDDTGYHNYAIDVAKHYSIN